LFGISLVFGVLLVIPIGGPTCDRDLTVELLCWALGGAMGFVLDSKLLIIAGALDGSSGLILSIIMSKAMNGRSRTFSLEPSARFRPQLRRTGSQSGAQRYGLKKRPQSCQRRIKS